MERALSSSRVYLSLLGRSAWALLNTYYAVECKIRVEHYHRVICMCHWRYKSAHFRRAKNAHLITFMVPA